MLYEKIGLNVIFMWNMNRGSYLLLGFFILLGVSFLCVGFVTSPDALTDDGYSLKNFFYMMGIAFTVLPIGTWLHYKISNDREKNLIQNGIKGMAEILDVEQTGWYVNDQPQLEFLLKITLPGEYPYQIKHKETVNYLSLGSMFTGAIHPVYVDPNNPKKIVLG